MHEKEVTLDLEGLRQFAIDLAPELSNRDRLLLQGPLGAGKSTFTQMLIQALSDHPVASAGSPSFPIIHLYNIQRNGSPLKISHIDCYRLETEAELEEAMVLDTLWESDGIVLVEWLDKWNWLVQKMIQTHPDFKLWSLKFEFHPTDLGKRKVRRESF